MSDWNLQEEMKTKTVCEIWLVLTAASLQAEIALNGIFSDGLILQRGEPVLIWGAAAPGEKVTVTFAGQQKETKADGSGDWKVELSPLEASSTGAELIVTGESSKKTVSDVLVGEVWLCSGQSNMAFTMRALKEKPDYANDLTEANFPLIRQAAMPREPSLEPVKSRKLEWVSCSPTTVEGFTAAGFYFARELQRELGVPVGIILSAWGGTSAESWTSIEALATVPEFKVRAEQQIENLKALPELSKAFPEAIRAWEQANGRVDLANEGETEGWMNLDASKEGWNEGGIKAKWSQMGIPNGGIAWIRKEIEVPAGMEGKGFRLDLGMVNEQRITVYWNGEIVGRFGDEPPYFYKAYKSFDIKEVKAGKNVLAIRFVTALGDRSPLGRSFGGIGLKRFGCDDEKCEVRIEKAFEPLSAEALAARPKVPEGDAAHTSSALFGGMIYPIIPLTIRGVVWYQGEQDAGRAFDYRTLLPLMITDWRTRWGRGDFPFLIQQLPNWKAGGAKETGWAELREAQWMTAQNLPNVAIAVGLDIGESDDVHPANKRDVGKRLALAALEKVYQKAIPSMGPVALSATKANDGKFRVQFRTTGALRTTDGAAPRLFAVAGGDKVFVDAEAVIDGDSVVVSVPEGVDAEAVRYAWINDTVGVNLTDETGLPAAPFRSDQWPIRGQK